jgi:hypothetical protein
MDIHGNTPAVIFNRTAPVCLDPYDDRIARPGHGLVDGVVQDLIDQMMEPIDPTIADIHLRPFADRVQATEDLDATGVVSLLRLHDTLNPKYLPFF